MVPFQSLCPVSMLSKMTTHQHREEDEATITTGKKTVADSLRQSRTHSSQKLNCRPLRERIPDSKGFGGTCPLVLVRAESYEMGKAIFAMEL